ncbi:hypothetical protein KJ641_03040 [Patescibacteria group bacterium]|nr:hypothetical protein [Patescibacteria group bacterium]MBU1895818.1 hypothetical protein [Patescibacteria group bacterium]
MDEDKVLQMLLKHEDDIQFIKENMSTKEDVRGIHDTLDRLVQLAERKDQEVTLHSFRLKEVTDILEQRSREIAMIKEKVGI